MAAHCRIVQMSWVVGIAFLCPSVVMAGADAAATPATEKSPELRQLEMELGKVGGLLAKAKDPAESAAYNLRQAEIIAHIINHSPPTEQPAWVRQMADCLGAAANNAPHDGTAYRRLVHLEEQIVRQRPGSDLAAYVTFLEMQIDFAAKQAAAGGDFTRAQQERHNRLEQFVAAYPQASDTPNALLELGMLGEFLAKDDDARKWYRETVERCAGTQLAFKAQGALRRLDLEGKYLFLELPALESENNSAAQTIDIAKLRGHVVIVYFWASWDPRCQRDFRSLATLLEKYHDQGLELLGINLDKNPEDARNFLRANSIGGIHAFEPQGMEGVVATRYGLMGLPTTFLVARSGKVAQRNGDASNLDDAVQQLLKQSGS